MIGGLIHDGRMDGRMDGWVGGLINEWIDK